MNIIDSSGWVEYFDGGGNADFFAAPIQDLEKLLVPTICVYEVFKRMSLKRGEEDALQATGFMSLGREIDLDREIAIYAAHISLELKLAMADSIILATAHTHDATLWTQDEHFKDIPGVKFVEKK
jgi:predicted nucleic acid-binding protein